MFFLLFSLPCLGGMTSGLLGRKIGVTGAHIITTSAVMISAILSVIAFYEVVLCHSPVTIHLGDWVHLSLIHISEPTRLHKVSRMPSSA